MSASDHMVSGAVCDKHNCDVPELTSKLGHDANRMSSVQRTDAIKTSLALRLRKDKKQRRNNKVCIKEHSAGWAVHGGRRDASRH